MPCAIAQLTEHQFSHIFVNQSFTVCFHKQLLLFANLHTAFPFSVPSVAVCWHSNIDNDSFCKFFWFIFFFILGLGGFFYRSTKLQAQHATLVT